MQCGNVVVQFSEVIERSRHKNKPAQLLNHRAGFSRQIKSKGRSCAWALACCSTYFLLPFLLAFFFGERFDFLAPAFFLAAISVAPLTNEHRKRTIKRSYLGCSESDKPLEMHCQKTLDHD